MVGRSPPDSVQFLLLLLMRKELRNLLQHMRDIELHQEAVSSALLRLLPVLFAAQ